MKQDLYKDFDIFSRALIGSRDVDPIYPFVKSLLKTYPFQPEWFVFCYVAFYNLESGFKMCQEFPTYEDFNIKRFIEMRNDKHLSKFGHERRGSSRNVVKQVQMFLGIQEFLKEWYSEIGKRIFVNNRMFRERLEKYPMHGGWASFKIAELFEKSLNRSNLKIKDLGLDGRDPNRDDSPIGGLRWLYGRDTQYDESFFPVWNRFGANLAKAWNVDIGEVETCLCKFHKLVTGKYYVGHDIHELVDMKEVLGVRNYTDIMDYNFNRILWWDVKSVNKSYKTSYKINGGLLHGGFCNNVPKADVFNILMETA